MMLGCLKDVAVAVGRSRLLLLSRRAARRLFIPNTETRIRRVSMTYSSFRDTFTHRILQNEYIKKIIDVQDQATLTYRRTLPAFPFTRLTPGPLILVCVAQVLSIYRQSCKKRRKLLLLVAVALVSLHYGHSKAPIMKFTSTRRRIGSGGIPTQSLSNTKEEL